MSTSYDVTSAISSPWLKGRDLADHGQPVTVTVKMVDAIEFDGQGEKFVLEFLETDKKLILNRTNLKTMAAAFGNQTSGWHGQKVVLTVGPAFNGNPGVALAPIKQNAGAAAGGLGLKSAATTVDAEGLAAEVVFK